MVSVLEGGAYLINGSEIVADRPEAADEIAAKTGKRADKEEARRETIAYGVLEEHNVSGSMDRLKIKFDKIGRAHV